LPSTLRLQSSSTLGAGITFTAQERLEKTEDKEVWRAIYSRQTSGHFADTAESEEGEDVVDAQDVRSENQGTLPLGQVVVVDSASTTARKRDVPDDVVVGSALQRNADGSIVKPRIVKKKGTSVCLLFRGVILTEAFQDHLAKVETCPIYDTTSQRRW
jgi:ATP-dependent RNA helicase DHX37/DHR1